METNNLLRKGMVIITSLLLIAACTASPKAPGGMPHGPGGMWHLVVISESSGWGLGDAYARQIEKDTGVKVVVDDFALSNLSAGEVLVELQTGKSLRSRLEELPAALKTADVVVMFGNPMDSVSADTAENINYCMAASALSLCSSKAFEKYTADLKAIWAKVFELRAGKPTILRAIDVASPFVADWKQSQVFEACTTCFECVSTSARQAAEAYGIPFFSRYDAFNGPKHDQDLAQMGYISSDGIHPNDLAQQHSAELLANLGYEPVPAP